MKVANSKGRLVPKRDAVNDRHGRPIRLKSDRCSVKYIGPNGPGQVKLIG